MTASQISGLVEAELSRITSPATIELIHKLLVPPRCEQRPWDYGKAGDSYPCWIVLEHPASNTGIAYCEYGFGPRCPWGLLFLSGHSAMGMDCGWFVSLEDALKDSFAWNDHVSSPEKK